MLYRLLFKYCLAITLIVWLSMPAHAQKQTKPYTNEMQAMEKRAMDAMGSEDCIDISDSLYQKALQLNDTMWMIRALDVQILWSKNNDQYERLDKGCDDVRQLVLGTRYQDSYFWARAVQIQLYTDTYHFSHALEKIKVLRADATEAGSIYGLGLQMQNLSFLYYKQGNTRLGDKYQLDAVAQFSKKPNNTVNSLPFLYVVIGALGKNNYQRAHEYMDMAMKYAKNANDSSEVMGIRCLSYYYENNRTKFKEAYKPLSELLNGQQPTPRLTGLHGLYGSRCA